MPRRYKTPSKPGDPLEPTVKILRARDSGSDGCPGIDSPGAGRPHSIFSYTTCVVACFRRYPQHQHSILVAHFALGLIIVAVLANWDRISRSFFGAYKAISYLIEVLLLCKVVLIKGLA